MKFYLKLYPHCAILQAHGHAAEPLPEPFPRRPGPKVKPLAPRGPKGFRRLSAVEAVIRSRS
jgi:hypothetical protein